MFIETYVGESGQGKSLALKKRIYDLRNDNVYSVAFDINNEYESINVKAEIEKQNKKGGYKTWLNDVRINQILLCEKTFFDIDEMLLYLETQKNLFVVIDEATSVFSYRGYNNRLNKLMHLRNHNNHLIVFVYHALMFVPDYIRIAIKYLHYFKTNDEEKEFKEWRIKKPLNHKSHQEILFKLI